MESRARAAAVPGPGGRCRRGRGGAGPAQGRAADAGPVPDPDRAAVERAGAGQPDHRRRRPATAAPWPTRSPTRLPGVGYVAVDGIAEPIRVRFSHITDDHIDRLLTPDRLTLELVQPHDTDDRDRSGGGGMTLRAAMVDLPPITDDMARELAISQKVCVRPMIRRVEDRQTGTRRTGRDPVRLDPRDASARPVRTRRRCCGCSSAPKAGTATTNPTRPDQLDDRAATTRPTTTTRPTSRPTTIEDDRMSRRVRSTRRRQDAPDLPRVPQEDRTVGRTFTAPDGTDVPAVDVPHPDPAVVRAGRPRPAPRRPGHAMTTGGRRWMRCTSRSWSTGSGRTCAAAPATRCSTSPPSNRNAASRRICMPRSAARSRASCSAGRRQRPTSRCGGRRSTSPSTSTELPVWDGTRLLRPGHR